VKHFLGIDGGGSKTAFLLIDDSGRVLSAHTEGPAYYLEVGFDEMRPMLARGIGMTLQQAALPASALTFAFIGLPSYGEDSRLLSALDTAAAPALQPTQYRCGNDAVCGWAGALACEDGINLICGTGSMAYGEFRGRNARAGGWGELFSDEGSAYWIAREGLNLFSRMSDGRLAPGPLQAILRRHFALRSDLDLCAVIYGRKQSERSQLAALAPLITEAARAGDMAARELFDRASAELAAFVEAVHRQLQVPEGLTTAVSYSGGMFQQHDLLLPGLRERLGPAGTRYRLVEPRLLPAAGAALYAAKLAGSPLSPKAIDTLQRHLVKD
jgi:N-acetylglucosamine kinase-like BadF-type ATPase